MDWCSSPVDPTFRHVCSSPSMVKSSHSKKNAEEIIPLLGLEKAAFYLGGTNDNASNAQHEILMTHSIIMDALETSDNERFKLDSIRSITEVNKGGRRVQDNENLRQQMSDEDAKASRLTQVLLTPEAT